MTQLEVLALLWIKRQELGGERVGIDLNRAGKLLVGKCIMALMADCRRERIAR